MALSGITVTGDKALLKKFKRLGSTVRKRVVRRPLQAALSPVVKATRREAPKGATKAVSKSIGKRVKTFKDTVWGAVGPRSDSRFWVQVGVSAEGAPVFHKPAKVGHLIEDGTKNVKANPFMKRGFQETRGRAFRIQADGIRKNIAKEAAKK